MKYIIKKTHQNRQHKLKNHHSVLYQAISIILLAILIVGLVLTFQEAFFHFNAVGRDQFWLSFFLVIAFILIIQLLFITALGVVKRISKTCISIMSFNIIGIIGTFIIYGILKGLYRVLSGLLKNLWNAIQGYSTMTLFWPAGSIWGTHSWVSTIVFVLLATGISTPLQYFFLRKDTKNKKRLFASILISALVCYSAISVFFTLNY